MGRYVYGSEIEELKFDKQITEEQEKVINEDLDGRHDEQDAISVYCDFRVSTEFIIIGEEGHNESLDAEWIKYIIEKHLIPMGVTVVGGEANFEDSTGYGWQVKVRSNDVFVAEEEKSYGEGKKI